MRLSRRILLCGIHDAVVKEVGVGIVVIEFQNFRDEAPGEQEHCSGIQPNIARASSAARNTNPSPAAFPKGASSWRARGFRDQNRSSGVPDHSSVVPARDAMTVPNDRKIPMAKMPRGSAVCRDWLDIP